MKPARSPRHQEPRPAFHVAVWVAIVLGACVHAPKGGDPSSAIAAFGDAVERKDYAAAYALMSGEYKARVSPADFRTQLEGGGAETGFAARKLRESAPRAELRIDLDLDLGEKLPMVMEGGLWRVDGQPFDLYGQKTPRAALRSFVRALERKRYDVVERLVPARFRPSVTVEKLRDYWEGEKAAENQELLRALRANMGARIVEDGDEAHMPYSVKAEVHFVREEGLWKIEDSD